MRSGLILAFCSVVLSFAQAQAGTVVASIKPLHSLVAAVMQGQGEPSLLVDGANSPHSFTLRPSQARALEQADIVFTIGPGMEHFLEKPLARLPASTLLCPMEKAEGMQLLKLRVGQGFEADDDDDGVFDPHIWLSVSNARTMARAIAHCLSQRYPAHKDAYEKNAAALDARLGALDADLKTRLSGFGGKPFIVFHDATQYFEQAYELKAAGSIIMHPGVEPGAKHLSELRQRIAQSGATCAFGEPQTAEGTLQRLLAGLNLRYAALDPEATGINPGPDLYFTLMTDMGNAFARCLTP